MSLTDSTDIDSKSEKPVSVIWGKVPLAAPLGGWGLYGAVPPPLCPPTWSSPALMPACPQGAS